MTEERLVLAELLEKAGEVDFLRAVAEGPECRGGPCRRAQCDARFFKVG
jgi:hypothetical protein